MIVKATPLIFQPQSSVSTVRCPCGVSSPDSIGRRNYLDAEFSELSIGSMLVAGAGHRIIHQALTVDPLKSFAYQIDINRKDRKATEFRALFTRFGVRPPQPTHWFVTTKMRRWNPLKDKFLRAL